MKVGVILARFQPIHNGHLALIEKAVKENDHVLILIGSADKFNKRNPIPIDLRESMVIDAFVEKFGTEEAKRIHPFSLKDLSDESDNSHDWGFYLYATMVKLMDECRFTIYYSDGFEIITTWFPPFMLRDYISLSLLARNGVEEGISATEVRKYIMNNEEEKLKACVPTVVYNMRSILKNFITIAEK